MPVKNVFLFAGQGSQYYGMGRDLLSDHPVFSASMSNWSTVFADLGLPGVFEEIYRADRTAADPFDEIRFTHPAILMVELAMAETLRAEGVEPDYVLGASLGEFAAAAAAGVLSPEDLARSVVEQVHMLERHRVPGAMLAVLGDVALYHDDEWLGADVELAAVNSDRNFVVSGDAAGVARAERRLQELRVLYQRLPVNHAFHSSRLDAVAEPYLSSLSRLTLRPPAVPFVSCESAGYVTHFDASHFWQLVRAPIRFREAIQFLDRQDPDVVYLDLGPSATMANFVASIVRGDGRNRAVPILDPFAPRGRALQAIRTQAGRSRRASTSAPGQGGKQMRAVVFPGQGSQARGMGGDLFTRFPDLTATADQILGYSVAELCREDPRGQLDQTQFTQPALFVVNALAYLARRQDGEPAPDYFAGHSLGEYNALCAAGAFDFATGLRLVCERGRLMAASTGGGMAAAVGLTEEAVREVLSRGALSGIDLANHNAPDQFIVSGPREAVESAREAVLAAGARAYLVLRVSGAFHSRYMEPARREFEQVLAGCEFRPPQVPVVANVTGRPYEPGSVREILAEQLVRPVRWERSVRHMLAAGVSTFDEVGPGEVLTGLVKKIRQAVPPSPAPAPPVPARRLRPEDLGSAEFRRTYGSRYAYVCGAMYRGIASEELVIRAARAGILAFFGTGGLDLPRIADAIDRLAHELGDGRPYGMNLVHNPGQPEVEDATVGLLLDRGVRNVEASAFMKITPALVRYRLSGLSKGADGEVMAANRVIAKVSRPEVAESFLSPAPQRLVSLLERDGLITAEQAALGAGIPMADDLCVEADSGGHTDRGDPIVLLPTMLRLRDRMVADHGYPARVRVGAAGGIGTPEAAAAAFVLGADFVVTGSINLCTAESGMSPVAKSMLEQINVQDTDYAPAGDMFELGAQVQVLKRGVFFPARARKLYELYRRHESLDEIDAETRAVIEARYFRKSFEEVWQDTRAFFAVRDPREIEQAEQNPKHKMALVFRWYFGHSQRAAMQGLEEYRVDFQVHCGPALGAFNQWVRGTVRESWRNRHVDEIGELMMRETAVCLEQRLDELVNAGAR
ncbi:ACP S-malonyltransferase [Phytohabitans flavus]|uniref:ACP S-malonyltransferase n=1 Tax=Phytohabitans flavus TaxID=1076124 RepID=UPI0031EBAD9B